MIGNKRNVAISVSNPRNISAFGQKASGATEVIFIIFIMKHNGGWPAGNQAASNRDKRLPTILPIFAGQGKTCFFAGRGAQ